MTDSEGEELTKGGFQPTHEARWRRHFGIALVQDYEGGGAMASHAPAGFLAKSIHGFNAKIYNPVRSPAS
jgi:hypothetical protein